MILVHVQAPLQGEVDVEGREHAQGNLVAVVGCGGDLVDAAARVGNGEFAGGVLHLALGVPGIGHVGLQARDGLDDRLDGGVHGHERSLSRGRRRRVSWSATSSAAVDSGIGRRSRRRF